MLHCVYVYVGTYTYECMIPRVDNPLLMIHGGKLYLPFFVHHCRYLIHQLKLAVQSKVSIFVPISADNCERRSNDLLNMYILKPGVAFHFFTSQTPCK